MQNNVFEQKIVISLDDIEKPENVENLLSNVIYTDLYSYFVGRKDNNVIIKLVTSLTDEYNTIDWKEAIAHICTSICDYIISLSNNKCICFKQAPIELQVELYQPIICKMARRLTEQWKQLEYDDVVSIANLCMVQLYRKGYYLNKYLIWTTLNNEIRFQYNRTKIETVTVSIYDEFKSAPKIDGEELSYGDIMEDESYIEEKEREDEQQLEKFIFEQVKEIIIDKIGERQWDRLWRDYGKGHTDSSTRASMRRLKDYFNELGLTRQDFINIYRR